MERWFQQEVGAAPAQYLRQHRFHLGARLLAESEEDLAGVAAAAGYFDQPHFTRECRSLTGLTPTQLREALGRSHERSAPTLAQTEILIGAGVATIPLSVGPERTPAAPTQA